MPYEGRKIEYRFDYYEQSNDSWSLKDAFGKIPELVFDQQSVKFESLKEKKPCTNEKGIKGQCFYYPGFVLRMTLFRNPWAKSIKFLIPTLILGVFLYMTFEVEQYQDRLNNLGFVLLALISILDGLRKEMPVLAIVTFGEKFVITFMITCLLPIIDVMFEFSTDTTEYKAQPGEIETKYRLRNAM
jgi:hypothetical protein